MKPTSGALIYTILVDGKPVVPLEARGREAAELCREEWFRFDLCALSSNANRCAGSDRNCRRIRPGGCAAKSAMVPIAAEILRRSETTRWANSVYRYAR